MDLGGAHPEDRGSALAAFPADTDVDRAGGGDAVRGAWSLIHEKMFESRMFFVDKLIGMGARIVLCDPHRAVVVGPVAAARGRRREPGHPCRHGAC